MTMESVVSDEKFETNLTKMIAASLYFLCGMQASREMFGKSYFSLSATEKAAVDQVVLGAVGGNYRVITPELLKTQAAQQAVGFQVPQGEPKQGS